MHLKTAPVIALKRLANASEGVIEGLASTFDVDRQGDRIMPGAFARSIAAFDAGELVVPLLLDHLTAIGSVKELEETSEGLRCVGQLALGNDEALRVFELAKAGPVPLSVHFTMKPDDYRMLEGERVITGLDLVEISVATIAANPAAATTSVKRADWSEIEHVLRDRRGLSARAAKRFVAEGRRTLSAAPDTHDDDQTIAAAILAAAQSIKT